MTQDNQAQIEYWNGEAGTTWVRAQEPMDAMLTPLSDQALTRAAAMPGERVIDVGCGCGTTTLALAERGARVHGIDISEPMLQRARERAAGMDNVEFSCTDAATAPFTPDHPLVFSRFGVMFFADPVAAFANLRRAMTEDGRLVFLCWQAPAVNPWISIPGRTVQPFLPDAPAADPKDPGPFAFADVDYLAGILEDAGFGGVEIDSATADLQLGDGLKEAMQFLSEIGPMARVLSELDGETRETALAAVREVLAAEMTADGLSLGAAAWLVWARRQ